MDNQTNAQNTQNTLTNQMLDEMFVTKRGGNKEVVSFDKILNRIKTLGTGQTGTAGTGTAKQGPLIKLSKLKCSVNYTTLTIKIIDQLFNNITTTQIDELSAQQCASLATIHTDYNILAGRIVVSNHHKNTEASFLSVTEKLYNYTRQGIMQPLISKQYYDIVKELSTKFGNLDNICDYSRDYLFDYFGFKTLENAYLMKINGVVTERPQHLWLRVAIAIHKMDMEKIIETYQFMSNKYFTHATPTLFNAGTTKQQLASCFLLSMESDSISGIYNTLSECAIISQHSGGIGLHIHNIRAKGSFISGTNGYSNGIVPMLRVYNNTAKYVDQGGGKRNGSFAIYLEPWHADIEAFLDLRKNHGIDELRARDLFYAIWMPDLFMTRVKANQSWTLMCPNECPGLADVYGADFVKKYEEYERLNLGKSTIFARDLWYKILDAQMETGTPYIVFKDAANQKSNQKNLGTIKSSNLCTEIIQYSDETETAVCNLGSIALPMFVDNSTENPTINYDLLHKTTMILTNNLNHIIDNNY